MRDIYINSNLNQLTKSVPEAEPPSSKMSSYETSQVTTKTVQHENDCTFCYEKGCPLLNYFFKVGFTPCMVEPSHYEAWSYKKKKHKNIKAYWKSVQKEPRVKRSLLILGLKPLRSKESVP